MPRSRYLTRSSNRSYSSVQPERRSDRNRSNTSSQSQDLNRLYQTTNNYSVRQSQSVHNNNQTPSNTQQTPSYINNGCWPSNSLPRSTLPISQLANIRSQMHLLSMPIINDLQFQKRLDVKFVKHNSYDDIKILLRPRCINDDQSLSIFQVNDLFAYLNNDQYRIFLRFCKYSSSITEQMDCLPKSFNLIINNSAFQVKNKYTFAPYDITPRIACEKMNEIVVKVSIDQPDYSDDYYYGVFLVHKVDHKKLLATFKQKEPYDINESLNLVKKKLRSDDDDVGIVDNLIKVSLLCPLSAIRIKVPARSKCCEHIHCFDAESFISINEITPRWKCPICKIFIKIDDLIIDGLFTLILKNAPSDCTEAHIFPDGSFDYVGEEKFKESFQAKMKRSNSSSLNNSGTNHKVEKQIECITLDSDDDDAENNKSSNINAIDEDDGNSSDDTILTDNSNYSESDLVINTKPFEDSKITSKKETSRQSATVVSSRKVGSKRKIQPIIDEDDDDDDIQIVFEKINRNSSSTSSSTSNSSTSNSSSSSSSFPAILSNMNSRHHPQSTQPAVLSAVHSQANKSSHMYTSNSFMLGEAYSTNKPALISDTSSHHHHRSHDQYVYGNHKSSHHNSHSNQHSSSNSCKYPDFVAYNSIMKYPEHIPNNFLYGGMDVCSSNTVASSSRGHNGNGVRTLNDSQRTNYPPSTSKFFYNQTNTSGLSINPVPPINGNNAVSGSSSIRSNPHSLLLPNSSSIDETILSNILSGQPNAMDLTALCSLIKPDTQINDFDYEQYLPSKDTNLTHNSYMKSFVGGGGGGGNSSSNMVSTGTGGSNNHGNISGNANCPTASGCGGGGGGNGINDNYVNPDRLSSSSANTDPLLSTFRRHNY